MLSNFDWIWWTAGGVLALLGLTLLYWSLLRDRARGRRRCPKCWYDMSGTPGNMVCSECGNRAKRERKLFKTRRRWGRATIACVSLLSAAFVWSIPRSALDGWLALVPTTALIAAMPAIETQFPSLYSVLDRRMADDELSSWQWRWLLHNCVSQDEFAWDIVLVEKAPGSNVQPRVCKLSFKRGMVGSSWLDRCQLRAFVHSTQDRTLSDVTLHESDDLAIPILSRMSPPDAELFPATAKNVRLLDLDVTIQRLASAQRTTIPAGSAKAVAPPTWVSIAHQRIKIPISDHNENKPRPVIEAAITRSIADRMRFVLTQRTLDIYQVFAFEDLSHIACPVRIELLEDGQVAGTWFDWCELSSSTNAGRVRALPLRSELQIGGRRPDSNWQVRVSGEPGLALWTKGDSQFWAGQMNYALRPADGEGFVDLHSMIDAP